MRIFTSALEGVSQNNDKGKVYLSRYLVEKGIKLKWNLMSYYYLRNHMDNADYIRDNSELVIIDSGAHTFQFGKKVNWDSYVEQYAEFIKKFDGPNVVGYFEMDVENVVGMPKVLQMRERLERASDKIIPVWHPTRGISDYEAMCQQYAGKLIAVGGFRGTDIKDKQFLSFVKVARKYGCKVHCLGMSRAEVLDKVPFDFTDSATWLTATNMGHPLTDGRQHQTVGSKRFPKVKGIEKFKHFAYNYSHFQIIQERYHGRWRKECND